MSAIGKQLRARAAEFRKTANDLLTPEQAAKLLDKPELLVAAITGHVSANVFEALADVEDSRNALEVIDEKMARRQKVLSKAAAIRQAAARATSTGNWDEYDKLTASIDAE